MIPQPAPSCQTPPWQQALQQAVRDPAELLALLALPDALLPAAREAARHFPLLVPRGFVARMRKGDIHDPLLRQVLPLAEELATTPGFVSDPVGDRQALRAPGLLHKYPGRALLITTASCAVHCRYCFRRHFPYHGNQDHAAALAAIRNTPSLQEVILSGGDPLSLSDTRLDRLLTELEAIPHVQRLRLHTRYPVLLPERLTDDLRRRLAASRLQIVMVIHANHARELDDTVREPLRAWRREGITLLNQAVLLRGVNDNLTALAELGEALFAAGVLPYYLHQLDRVQGAAHFEVPEAQARALHRALRDSQPGYLVPRLVRETPGTASKTPL